MARAECFLSRWPFSVEWFQPGAAEQADAADRGQRGSHREVGRTAVVARRLIGSVMRSPVLTVGVESEPISSSLSAGGLHAHLSELLEPYWCKR